MTAMAYGMWLLQLQQQETKNQQADSEATEKDSEETESKIYKMQIA